MGSEPLSGSHTLALDASVCNVYSGTRLVVFMITPYSKESYDYVDEHSKDVPLGIAILILLNFRDTIAKDESEPTPTLLKVNSFWLNYVISMC